MKKLPSLLAASGAASVIAAGSAMAQAYPASVTGNWTILANNTQAFTITINTQSTDSPCALLNGTFPSTADSLVGYYCPATGAVSFLRNSGNTNATFQVFTGSLSSAGAQNQMTGSFTNYSGGNNVGAFSFSAVAPGS
jgi:hypothetical protein